MIHKRISALFIGAITLFAGFPLFLAAIEMVDVIDFGRYEARALEDYKHLGAITNRYDTDGAPRFVLKPEIMMLSNWHVVVQSSGIRITHIVNSMCKAVRKKAHQDDPLGETDVLGVRIRFPHTRQNDRAIIKPQFEFHAYNTNGQFANVTNGVVVNVGLIRDVSVWVKGRNYPYDFAARLWDHELKTHEFFFGNLMFENWRKLTWVNPNYIDQVKDRVLVRHPLYPKDVPYMRFQSFVIYRNMDQIGGDFIVYIKNLSMVYERYVETIMHDDIDDEEQWGIMRDRAQKQMDRETKKLADKADIYRSEMKRLDKDR